MAVPPGLLLGTQLAAVLGSGFVEGTQSPEAVNWKKAGNPSPGYRIPWVEQSTGKEAENWTPAVAAVAGEQEVQSCSATGVRQN